MQRRRGFKQQIPEEDYQAGPQGLKFFDMTAGKGALPRKGDRITVHYEVRWHGVTFMTSRYGVLNFSSQTTYTILQVTDSTTALSVMSQFVHACNLHALLLLNHII